MHKFILALAALAMSALACSTTAVAMTKPPVAITEDDIKILTAIMTDPADAVGAHQKAGTFTPALAKSVKGYLDKVANYGTAANKALATNDPVSFHANLANAELNKQRACKRLANCREDGRAIRPGV